MCCFNDFQTSDTAINIDHEEWILDPDKTLAESDISKRNTDCTNSHCSHFSFEYVYSHATLCVCACVCVCVCVCVCGKGGDLCIILVSCPCRVWARDWYNTSWCPAIYRK